MGNDFIHQKNESTFLVMESWRKGTFFLSKNIVFFERNGWGFSRRQQGRTTKEEAGFSLF